MRRYDPFGDTPAAGVTTIELYDSARARRFPCELWYPSRSSGREAAPKEGAFPLVLFSPHSGGGRSASSFLCRHLAAHGYVVAAMDHSEVVADELRAAPNETPERRAQRIDAWIASRVPDLRFLLANLLDGGRSPVAIAGNGVGAVGHSFGGWAVLETAVLEKRISSIVALAPAGGAHRRTGMLPVTATLNLQRAVAVLYVAAELDASIPLDSIEDLFDRTPGCKRLVVIPKADHLHFVDQAETSHEAVRAMNFPKDLAWLRQAMRPFGELLPEAEAHRRVRGYALAHLDATLKAMREAVAFWNTVEGRSGP